MQFHNNGEPFLYPKIGKALKLFDRQIRCLDTNGKLLFDKADEVIENLDTITISTFENDPEWEEQYDNLKKFLEIKKDKSPNVVIRCLGNIGDKRRNLYKNLNCIIADRILHSPMGSFNYEKKTTSQK